MQRGKQGKRRCPWPSESFTRKRSSVRVWYRPPFSFLAWRPDAGSWESGRARGRPSAERGVQPSDRSGVGSAADACGRIAPQLPSWRRAPGSCRHKAGRQATEVDFARANRGGAEFLPLHCYRPRNGSGHEGHGEHQRAHLHDVHEQAVGAERGIPYRAAPNACCRDGRSRQRFLFDIPTRRSRWTLV